MKQCYVFKDPSDEEILTGVNAHSLKKAKTTMSRIFNVSRKDLVCAVIEPAFKSAFTRKEKRT